jgi:diguanylate cyclase (GGDEF)-like protein
MENPGVLPYPLSTSLALFCKQKSWLPTLLMGDTSTFYADSAHALCPYLTLTILLALLALGMKNLLRKRASSPPGDSPLNALIRVTLARAHGDLFIRYPENLPGDFGDLARALNQAIQEEETHRAYLQERLQEVEKKARTLDQINTQLLETSAKALGVLHELEWQNARLEDLNDRLELLATTDGLTGLHNHRTFQERFRSAFAHSKRYNQPMSLIMLDVDHFKNLNDSLGHPTGDAVLVFIANVIKSLVRKSDCVARYGGEEFAILLPNTKLSGALRLARRIRERLDNAPEAPAPFTVSLGVAELTPEMKEPDDLLTLADSALYEAKRSGRNRVVSLQEPPRRKQA